MKKESEFICEACGADRDCTCEAKGIPKKQREALKEYKKNPARSVRTIAKKVGVSVTTVQKAISTVPKKSTVERRISRNGKSYPATQPRRKVTKPHTMGNVLMNLNSWLVCSGYPKMRDRFEEGIKEATEAKDFGEQTRGVLIDMLNKLRSDIGKWIEAIDAIQLNEHDNVVSIQKARKHERG
jgi:DNA-binding transcriptional regulator YhcF (GntR family)